MVPHMVSCRRMDVYRINIKFMCHLFRSVCGRYTTGHLSQHYVDETSKIVDSWFMGAVICYLLSTVSWMEGRRKGEYQRGIFNSFISAHIETDDKWPRWLTTKTNVYRQKWDNYISVPKIRENRGTLLCHDFINDAETMVDW